MARARIRVPRPDQILRWLFGVPIATVQWLRRRCRFDRIDEDLAGRMEAPEVALGGVGPGYHRRYSVRITDAQRTPEEIIAAIGRDPNIASPDHVARFTKERGTDATLTVGDEFDIELAGPWNGPVRVLEVGTTSFRLHTLEGHAESGEIEFRCRRLDTGDLEFEIESWARSSDALVGFLYDRVGVVREMQLNMWGHFLDRVATIAEGAVAGDLHVHTQRHEAGVVTTGTDPRHQRRGRRELERLRGATWNVDDIPTVPGADWRVDDHLQPLPAEPPGEPVTGGPWQIGVQLLHDYEFVDPAIIRAVYDRSVPLAERTMALHGRFWTLDFWMGVRVSRVIDEERTIDGRAVRINGYAYRTLERHLESGEISFELWKWLDSGEVEFRMHAVSRAAHIPNPAVRVGFRMFGRRLQLAFARRAKERMLELVEAKLAGAPRPDVPAVVEALRD